MIDPASAGDLRLNLVSGVPGVALTAVSDYVRLLFPALLLMGAGLDFLARG